MNVLLPNAPATITLKVLFTTTFPTTVQLPPVVVAPRISHEVVVAFISPFHVTPLAKVVYVDAPRFKSLVAV